MIRNESTRAVIYRAAIFALIVYVAVARPDHFTEWVPVILGLGNVLAAANTQLR